MEAAVAAAKAAFPAWSGTTPEERAKVLNKVADLITANLEELARAESRDQGARSGPAVAQDCVLVIQGLALSVASVQTSRTEVRGHVRSAPG